MRQFTEFVIRSIAARQFAVEVMGLPQDWPSDSVRVINEHADDVLQLIRELGLTVEYANSTGPVQAAGTVGTATERVPEVRLDLNTEDVAWLRAMGIMEPIVG